MVCRPPIFCRCGLMSQTIRHAGKVKPIFSVSEYFPKFLIRQMHECESRVCQPETRHPPSTLLRLAPDFGRDLNSDNVDCSRPCSCALELPCLRRNHACRRTALRGSTPA